MCYLIGYLHKGSAHVNPASRQTHQQITPVYQRLPDQLLAHIVHPHLPLSPAESVTLVPFILAFDEKRRNHEDGHERLDDEGDGSDEGA
jgi:hypothetical protein